MGSEECVVVIAGIQPLQDLSILDAKRYGRKKNPYCIQAQLY
jgi:hypothetical protein